MCALPNVLMYLRDPGTHSSWWMGHQEILSAGMSSHPCSCLYQLIFSVWKSLHYCKGGTLCWTNFLKSNFLAITDRWLLFSPEGKTQGPKTNWWSLLEHCFTFLSFIIIIYFKGKHKRVKGYYFSSGYPKPQEGSLQRHLAFPLTFSSLLHFNFKFPQKNIVRRHTCTDTQSYTQKN